MSMRPTALPRPINLFCALLHGLIFLWLAGCSPASDSLESHGEASDFTKDRTAEASHGSLEAAPGVAQRQLIVLAAPQHGDEYYVDHYDALLDFQIAFARAAKPHDDVVILATGKSLQRLRAKLSAHSLLEARIDDVWIRDFGPVYPQRPVLFRYDRTGPERGVQAGLLRLVQAHGLKYSQNTLKVDGGNFVHDGARAAVMTVKVFRRNKGLPPIALRLRRALNLQRLAFIPMDPGDTHLGHADGMVSFIEPGVLFMNEYPDNPGFAKTLRKELRRTLPGTQVQTLPGSGYGKAYGDYASACGLYTNAAVTDNAVYLPVFDQAEDDVAIARLRKATRKAIVPVFAGDICELGGSVRCLSWQLRGENARRLREAAAK